MTTSESTATGSPADIERTREEIGETVQALFAKVDVKARARQKADQVRGRLTSRAGTAGTSAGMAPTVRRSGAGLVALVTAVVAAWLWRRRRTRRHGTWHRATHRTTARPRTMRARSGRRARIARAHSGRAAHRVRR